MLIHRFRIGAAADPMTTPGLRPRTRRLHMVRTTDVIGHDHELAYLVIGFLQSARPR
jgi:hypothetical protein